MLQLLGEQQTNFLDFKSVPPKRVSMSVPIVLPITAYTKVGTPGPNPNLSLVAP